MPEERLKFRCYKCNQLLSATRKKAGTVIACPRCKAELKVPEPQEEAEAAGAIPTGPNDPSRPGSRSETAGSPPSSASAPLPSFMEEIAAAIPDELASLRPEDIRVEAEFADLVVTTTEPVPPPLAAPAEPESKPVSRPEPLSRPEPVRPASRSPDAEPRLTEAAPEKSAPRFLPPEDPPVEIAVDTALPAITIEPATILTPNREIRSVSEVVLQPATVLAWSLLVLMAIPMAFVAGLLMGHFVWK